MFGTYREGIALMLWNAVVTRKLVSKLQFLKLLLAQF